MAMTRKRADPTELDSLRDELVQLRAHNEVLQTELYDLRAAHRIIKGEDESYWALVRRVREVVQELVPRDRTVLVISKGDDSLIDLYGRPAWHFPRTADGRYAGYYPKRGLSAIAHLEALRALGADYLLIPEPSFWWLEHYGDFKRHLDDRYHRLDSADTCVLYSLRSPVGAAERRPEARLRIFLDDHKPILGDDPSILDWETGSDLASALPERRVFSPIANGDTLPYLDRSIDVVVIRTVDEGTASEAERVAAKAVLNLSGRPRGRKPSTKDIRWMSRSCEMHVPTVSIVIPCHNGLRHTAACIATLSETLPPWFRGEVVVVDDASSDGTAAYVASVSEGDRRFGLIRNETNVGFLTSCNIGASAAKGEFVLFLNNDTILLPGWLAPLLQTFSRFPDVGVVGGKLLFEDGTLQEAGALVFSDASAAKIGYLEPDVEAPFIEYLRETDYVSAAFLMTPRKLFLELGGLDSRYGFGYYDDDDYCFTVRAAGRKVYYQPESVIVHVEGASAGTDLSRGLKQYQMLNQAVFAEKWADVVVRQPERPAILDWFSYRWLETTRPRTVRVGR